MVTRELRASLPPKLVALFGASPLGNRQMRRVLNQAANAAVKVKGTIFAIVYRRLVPRLGHAQAIGANRASTLAPDLKDSSRAGFRMKNAGQP